MSLGVEAASMGKPSPLLRATSGELSVPSGHIYRRRWGGTEEGWLGVSGTQKKRGKTQAESSFLGYSESLLGYMKAQLFYQSMWVRGTESKQEEQYMSKRNSTWVRETERMKDYKANCGSIITDLSHNVWHEGKEIKVCMRGKLRPSRTAINALYGRKVKTVFSSCKVPMKWVVLLGNETEL